MIASVLLVGWVVVYDEDDIVVSIRVNNADLSRPDEIPMNVDLKIESGKDHDIDVDYVELELYNEEGGVRLLKQLDGPFVIPAGGEVVRNYQVTLTNVESVEDAVFVDLFIQFSDRTEHIRRTVDLDEFVDL